MNPASNLLSYYSAQDPSYPTPTPSGAVHSDSESSHFCEHSTDPLTKMFASYLVLDSVKLPFNVNNKSNKPSRLAVTLSRRGIGGRLGRLLGSE